MKVKVNYNYVNSAVEKLSSNKPLTEQERSSIISVIDAVRGDYIPTDEETSLHRTQCNQLDSVNYETNPVQWNRLADSLTVYENKYC